MTTEFFLLLLLLFMLLQILRAELDANIIVSKIQKLHDIIPGVYPILSLSIFRVILQIWMSWKYS